MNSSSGSLELALQAAVRRHLDPLVKQANADAALLEGSRMEKSQIRNVLNVAGESQSLAVVTNFIRYQLGRSQTGPAWQKKGFGLQVIEQIEKPDGIVPRLTKSIVEQVKEQFGEVPQEAIDDLRYDLMRYYLGYLNRAFYYGNETNKWDELREAGEEG